MAFADIPFRIRVGVTGHRVLADPERLAASVRIMLDDRISELFDRPVSRAALITPFAFTIVTPLAEGADRLVASEVMKTPAAELEVVLPLALDEYLRDFDVPESKVEFDQWLKRAGKIMQLPLNGPAAGPGGVREAAYEAAGRFVVDHCDLLVALWDGRPSRGRGGTAEIVAYSRDQGRPLVVISTEDSGAIQIEKGVGLSSRALDQIESFNRFQVDSGTLQQYVSGMDRWLFQNPEGEGIPPEIQDRIRQRWLPWYARISLIAKRNQKRHFQAGGVVYVLSPLAVAAVALGILSPGWAQAAFLAEFGILLMILAVIWVADRWKVHRKWIEARFLTERVRAAIFLHVCGVEPSVFDRRPIAGTTLPDEGGILLLFEEILHRVGPPRPCPEALCPVAISFVRRRWLIEQRAFHAAKAARAGRLSRFLERTGQVTFLLAIGAAAFHLFSPMSGYPAFLVGLEKPAVFLALVLPALGAAIGGIRSHREYSRLAKRSGRMETVLRELERRFDTVMSFSGLRILLQETERLMLQETQDWLLLMRFARVEPI